MNTKIAQAVTVVATIVALGTFAVAGHSTSKSVTKELHMQYSPVEKLTALSAVGAALDTTTLAGQGLSANEIQNGSVAEIYDQVENAYTGKHTILHRTVFVPQSMASQVKEGSLIAFNRLDAMPVMHAVVTEQGNDQAYACVKTPGLIGISNCVEKRILQYP